MLIFSQDRTMLLNIDSGIYTIEAKERWVVAIAGRRQVGAVMMEAQETVLGEYSFYRKKITTLLVGEGKAEVQEVDTVPEWADYAVSGIPLLRNGKAAAQADILAQGWDTSPLRATWHTVVGLKGDGKIYVMGWQSTTSNLVTSGEAAASFRAMGFTDVVKLDGGGSFAFQTAQGGQKTSENRRINSVLRFGGADEQPQEPEQPAPDPDYEKWKSYMARWEAEKAALPVSGWAEELLAEAVSMGITDGTRPQAPATRQEVALMVRAKVTIKE